MRAEFAENPYRAERERRQRLLADVGEQRFGAARSMWPRPVGETGPGLTGADLDRMCRQHYLDGHASREREIDELRAAHAAALERAFDEGAAAQDGLNSRLVWGAVRRRLVADVAGTIDAIADATSSATTSDGDVDIVAVRRAAKDAREALLAVIGDVSMMERRPDLVWDDESGRPSVGVEE